MAKRGRDEGIEELAAATWSGVNRPQNKRGRPLGLPPLNVPARSAPPARLLSSTSGTSSLGARSPRGNECEVAGGAPAAGGSVRFVDEASKFGRHSEPQGHEQGERGRGGGDDAGRRLSAKLVRKAMERGCRCGRTRCLKQYCQCFRNDLRCGIECLCDNCYNDGKHETERGQAIRNIRVNHPTAFRGTALELEDQVVRSPGGTVRMVRGCRCKRSRCQKKYCECFGAGLKCSANCLCTSCRNGNEQMGAGVMPNLLAELSRKPGGDAAARPPPHHQSAPKASPRVGGGGGGSPSVVERAEMALLAGPRASPSAAAAGAGLSKPHHAREHLRELNRDANANAIAASPPTTAPRPPRQPLSTDTVSDAEGGGGAEDSAEFERLLAVQLASATTPRFLHLPTDTTPRTGATPRPRPHQGWGDESPVGPPSGGGVWGGGGFPALPSPASPSSSSVRIGLFVGSEAPPSAGSYGAPLESFGPPGLARMTSSRLHRDTPPCTPIGEEVAAPLSLGAAGWMGGCAGEVERVESPPESTLLAQPPSWGAPQLERGLSGGLVFV